jgi:hypothetical protein
VIKLINLNHNVVVFARDVVVTANVFFVVENILDLMLLFALIRATN